MSYKAFVSSTYLDLKDHRTAVIRALRKAEFHVDPMEDWTADNHMAKTLSTKRLDGCDLCILLIGARRGHVPDGELISITQMEYREARRRGIEVLPFLYDGESAWPPKYLEFTTDPAVAKWRALIREEHTCGTFSMDTNYLEGDVQTALTRWCQAQEWPKAYADYQRNLHDAHGVIHFLGIGRYNDFQPFAIDQLFVRPQLATYAISSESTPETWETTELLALLEQEKRVVLLGDPGSGKSTLVNWLVWNLTDERQPLHEVFGEVMPIVLVVRDLKLGNVSGWKDLLDAYFERPNARRLRHEGYRSEIENRLSQGDAFILIDGLDEMNNPALQRRLREAIREGLDLYPDCHWLLTSRIVGYREIHVRQHSELPVHLIKSFPKARGLEGADSAEAPPPSEEVLSVRYLVPFSNEQVRQFANNWFREREPTPIEASQKSTAFFEAITDNPYTLRLARTPNLLTIMALVFREQARLPDGRALLYTEISNAYLESIDQQRRLRHRGFTLREQKLWLGRVAYYMQQQRTAREDDDREILASKAAVSKWVIEAMQGSGRQTANEEAAHLFIDEVTRRSGLLLPRGDQRYAFVHLSFQEYFAAVYLKEGFKHFSLPRQHRKALSFNAETLQAYADNTAWHETLIFLSELVSAEEDKGWQEHLMATLFGAMWEAVYHWPDAPKGKPRTAYTKAMLLAKLLANPHAGFQAEDSATSAALCACVEAEHVRQMRGVPFGDNDAEIYSELFRTAHTSYLLGTTWSSLANTPVIRLSLRGCKKGSILQPIASLQSLQVLDLTNSQVTDLHPLASLQNLKILDLTNSQVTDLHPLASLQNLQVLDLTNSQVTDLHPLANLQSLQELNLTNSQVSRQDVQALREALPNCGIYY